MARSKSRKSDAIAMLEADHRKVEELFEEFEDADENAERQRIAEQVFPELDIHSQLEEEIFYPAVAAKSDEIKDLGARMQETKRELGAHA